MAELKAGGLAIVIKSTDPDQVGNMVTLLQLISPGNFLLNGNRYISKASGPVWLCERPDAYVTHYPSQLLPIEGDDFQREDERQKELIDG